MLILKAYSNLDLVGEIHIQNVGQHGGDWFEYRIRKPEGHDKPVFLHRRSSGWMPLAEKALHYLRKVRPADAIEPELGIYEAVEAAIKHYENSKTQKGKARLDKGRMARIQGKGRKPQ